MQSTCVMIKAQENDLQTLRLVYSIIDENTQLKVKFNLTFFKGAKKNRTKI